MRQKVTAIIPARHEQSSAKQNTLEFGESNLLVHKIRQLKQVDAITEVIVSSEDDDILTMADKEGARQLSVLMNILQRHFLSRISCTTSLVKPERIMLCGLAALLQWRRCLQKGYRRKTLLILRSSKRLWIP